MCGLPGSGKTTLARRLAVAVPAVRLCPDEWMTGLDLDLFDEQARSRVEGQLWRHAQDLLGLGQNVILEYGFWDRQERDEKRLAARALGVGVELYHLTASLDELAARIDSRTAEGVWGSAPVTRSMLEEYAKLFDAPTADELALFDRPPPNATSKRSAAEAG